MLKYKSEYNVKQKVLKIQLFAELNRSMEGIIDLIITYNYSVNE